MLSFFDLKEKLDSEALVNDYFEAIASPALNTKDNVFKYRRSQGDLRPNDPLNQYKSEAPEINIVWITGMWSGIFPGTGRYSELLQPLGYNVKVVRTISDIKSAGLGRIVRHLPFLSGLHKKWAGDHVAKNQEKVAAELGDESPDIIIGSSQGGAIALSIATRYKETPMALLCPAWKIFGVQPTYLNPNSVIIHGINDFEVPFVDSQELAKMFNVPLIPTKDGHIMHQGLSVLISQLKSLTSSLSQTKRKRQRELDLQKQKSQLMPQVENVEAEIPISIWLA